jgi:hypothetical protein
MFKRLPFSNANVPVFILIFVCMLAVTYFRFRFHWPDVFVGDDLTVFLDYKDGIFGSNLQQVWLGTVAEKFRPIFNLALSSELKFFGLDFYKYLILNSLLQALNATLVFAIFRRISCGNTILAIALSAAIASSRFALYQVAQALGVLEGLALTLFLVCFYCVLRAWNDERFGYRWALGAVCAIFLATHVHERFIVVSFLLPVVFWKMPTFRTFTRSQTIWIFSCCLFVPVFNVICKTALGLPFLVGTGGTHYSFDIQRTIDQLQQVVFSIFQWNEGPQYLVGVRTLDLPWFPAFIAPIFFDVIWVATISFALNQIAYRRTLKAKLKDLVAPSLLICLAGFLAGPPLLTIRIEQRWLFAPYIIALAIFAWAAGSLRERWRSPVTFAAIILGGLSISVDSRLIPYCHEIFFVFDVPLYSALKRDIVGKHLTNSLPIAFVSGEGYCSPLAHAEDFFRLYEGQYRKVFCFSKVDDIKSDLPKSTLVYIVKKLPQIHFYQISNSEKLTL